MHPVALLIAAALAFPSANPGASAIATASAATGASGATVAGSTASRTAVSVRTAPRPLVATKATTAATVSEAPVPVAASNVPPAGRRLSADRVLAIAQALPKMRAVRAGYRGSYGGAYLKGPARWQVSFFSKNGAKEIGQVIIADADGRVLEQWTGFQVAWSMARGYPGAFGRHVNALYIWLPLCVLFLLPFVDPRRPFSLLHLDLLALLSFGVSLAFFNHGRIYASVPLAYPPLAYLLARMLWTLRRRERRRVVGSPAAGSPAAGRFIAGGRRRTPKLLFPTPWVALAVVFLLGFRIALNVSDSNVIDVGYAGVIGASKVVHGRALYGRWPRDNEHGDTYGPASYEAYVPFERLFGWSGTWDDLPAAHAAAIFFDLLALGLLFLLGLRIRGPTLAVALAYAWVSYPFTLFALESNTNDTLVAVFVLAALLAAGAPPVRALRKAASGAMAALAGLTKLAPLALAPVLATHGLRVRADSGRGGGRGRGDGRWRGSAPGLAAFGGAFALTVALAAVPALEHDSLRTIYERTVEYQANRGSPFSVWGLYGWHGAEKVVLGGAVALALALAFLPRRPDLVGLAAACAAILLALQLGVEHWFYLYIPWFFPLVMIALLGGPARTASAPDGLAWLPVAEPALGPPVPGAGTTRAPVPLPDGARGEPPLPAPKPDSGRTPAPAPGAASGSARLRLPSAGWGRSG